MKKSKQRKPHRPSSKRPKAKKAIPINRRVLGEDELKKIAQFVKIRFPSLNIYPHNGRIRVDCPKIMRMSDEKVANVVLQFLQCIRYICGLERISASINIVPLQDISPMCAFLLASEFHRWQLVKNIKLSLTDAEQWNPNIKILFAEMGMFDLVLVENAYLLSPRQSPEKFIKLRSDRVVKMKEALGNIDNEVAKIALVMQQNPRMYGGIEEAVTNVTQWAYKDFLEPNNKIRNRWWFCASYNLNTKRTTIMVYDHGQGVPSTLPLSGRLEEIQSFLSGFDLTKWGDAEIIEAAINSPRTASREGYRGKGLKWMKDLLPLFRQGTLMILSGSGEYRIDHNGQSFKRKFQYPLSGTLIVWEVYGQNDNENEND